MSKELIVSAGRHETKVAILEDDQVVELFHEREKEYSLAGSIHKGRVTRVLPGMQSAFVNIGLDRDAFLYVSDFFEDNDEYEAVVSTVEDKVLKMERSGAPAAPVSIERPAMVRQAGAGVEEAPVAENLAVPPSPAPERRGDGRTGSRPEHSPSGSDRGADRGDRGGRGRRGRRRRGGRDNGGIPESKFFSPRAEPVAATEPPPESEPADTPTHSYSSPAASAAYAAPSPSRVADDFMVLPGESLAKYSGSAPESLPEPEAPELDSAFFAEETVVEEALLEDTVVEAAVPGEHPLAGLGVISSWLNEKPVVKEPQAEKPEPVAETPIEAETAEAAETAKPEPVAEAAMPEAPGEEPEAVSERDDVEDTAEETDETAGEAVLETVEEGAEPLVATAAVREPGQRYPHRVSRRMRRKQRTGQSGEERGPRPSAEEERTAVAPQPEEVRQESQERDRAPRERVERERPPLPSISDLLKEGQEIVVQIAKEPLGQKGARITSHIALPGRFVVYMPTVEHVGVSRKIPSDEERQRLKRVLQTHRQGVPGGFICRTAAEGKTEEELKADMHFLYNLWLDMRQKAERKPAPVLLHHDLDLVQRILRDQLTTSFKTIWVDNEELYESVLRFVQRFQPALVGRVKLYTRSNPIFDEFGITAEIEKALRPKVWLKSGGYIVINQTEALVAIDINTGKYVGKSNRLEDTIVKINSDAIKEIVRQIRLRDLGGIIVVDFIDMDERKNRQKVMLALEEGMRADRAPYKILQFNDFGLVAITRKRVKQSLERTLCTPCAYCEGAGYIKSAATVVTEILQEAQRLQKALASETGNVVLRVNPEVAKLLKSTQNSFLQEIEEIAGRTVLVKSDPLLHQTKFDLA